MNPRLVALNGPAEGQTFLLREGRFTLGRQADNDLPLPSLAVSRRHCELRRDADGGYTVADLESRHGVFVNSRPVRERRLVHSDLLTVGGFVLLYLLDDSAVAPASVAPADAPFIAGSTLARRPTEILYLDRARVDAALPAQARIARDLHTLLQVSTALQGPLSSAELGERLLAPVLELVPAGHAAVLLAEPGADELTALAERGRGGEPGFPNAAELLAQVLRDKVGLLCEGTAAGGPRSLLAAPLLGHDGLVRGVIGCTGESQAFDERHLELLTAIAGIAAPAFDNALRLERLERENRRLREHQLRHDMVGESAAMRRLLDLIARVARAETTVLIRGESGTGKELAAQALHRSSPRAGGPFVAINCATLSETLLESELFGHEKGAFTGAIERKTGKIEAAEKGTLFLDEVGEIPRPLQAKLLRVLQEREFVRVGGTRPLRADVRVIAATNRDLETAIRDGSFREDLYYRLKVITLETPALRQRPEDIPLLASHFAAVHGRRLGRPGVGISPEARRCLAAYPWPGNVRELGNVIERALVLGETDAILPEDLPEEVVEGAASVAGELHAARLEHKKKLVLAAWREAGADYAAAAARLGVHVNSFHRMVRQLGLKGQLDR